MTKKARRDIKEIGKELRAALERETKNVITIGDLLIEAKEQLDYGDWLEWLGVNFGDSVSTAENYMRAARVATRFVTVTNLKLRPTALYLLGRDLWPVKVVKAVLKAAETEWISGTRAHQIAAALQPKPKTVADDKWTETEEILDGPLPELPPTPETTEYDTALLSFNQAVSTLAHLHTKQLSKFVGTGHPVSVIRAVSVFLQEVSEAIEREAKAAPREIEKV